MLPETVAAFAGDEMETVGGVVSGTGALLTVTDTAAEVVLFPAASRAIAFSEWVPFAAAVVFHETL
jgi:hypothetical protein